MKQFIYIILAGCVILLSGCQKEVPTDNRLEPEQTVLDAAWQEATTPPQTEPTTGETFPVTEERSDASEPSVPASQKPTSHSKESTPKSSSKEPASEEREEDQTSVPTEEVKIPTTAATEPVKTEPQETIPAETVPIETESPETVPTEAESPEAETSETEPPATENQAEKIDTAALESYGRSYASSTYGYNGTSACTPGTGAGYFPAATKEILSMEDGYSYVRQAIDSQYNRDMAYGYLPYEEIDGKTVRCPINVSVDSAGGNTYTITVYYGGTA